MKVMTSDICEKVIDMCDNEYKVIFEADSGFILTIQGIHACDHCEAVAVAELAMRDHYTELWKDDPDLNDIVDTMCDSYTILSIERIRK